MNFFEHQHAARSRSRKLYLLYFFAVAGVVLLVDAGFFFATKGHLKPEHLTYIALGTLIIIFIGSLYRIATLKQSPEYVAISLGGRLLVPSSAEANERRLLNIVEEMALASGIPIPEVYLLDHEEGINAFATGFDVHHAVIGVTRGALEKLSRDELQGVIGHEFSHILNSDMTINLRLMGLAYGLLCIAMLGRTILRATTRNSGRRSKDSSGPALFGLILLLAGSIGVFAANLIKAAICRQREFLADASAVQFTRNPLGISGALRRIGESFKHAYIENSKAEEASHFFFADALGTSFLQLMASHPPLDSRISRIEGVSLERIQSEAADQAQGVDSLTSMSFAGSLNQSQVSRAREALDKPPVTLKDAARSPNYAPALVAGLFASSHADVLTRQEHLVASSKKFPEYDQAIWSQMQVLSIEDKFSLFTLALPALRRLTPERQQDLLATYRTLAEADDEVTLAEYAFLSTLESVFSRNPFSQAADAGLAIQEAASTIISAVCVVGTDNPEHAKQAFLLGAGLFSAAKLSFIERAGLTRDHVQTAIDQIRNASDDIKAQSCAAMIRAAAWDGQLHEKERNLIRIVGQSIGVPLPPIFAA
ncbi:M48 family metallopeptidase [bacterium]|nr:M48 family metallopeptidase [bacterium]